MPLRVSGKNLDIGESLRTHVLERIEAIMAHYHDGRVSGHVVISREGSGYRADCALHLSSGVDLQAEGKAHEPYPSFEAALDKIERRLRRYKTRLKARGSASEIGYAEELGCEIVKVFPGGAVGGPDFVKSMLGPCPWTKIMPTGGVDCSEDSLTKWFKAGVVCVGIGSNLVTKELLDAKDYSGVEKRVRDTIALIRKIRGK